MTKNEKDYNLIANDVATFNNTFGKPIATKPVIADSKRAEFCYNFILEEANEFKEAVQNNDIVEVLDAVCDLAYVAVGDVLCAFGLIDKFPQAFQEVQASNMSKSCKTIEEAEETVKVRSEEHGPCHWEKQGDLYIVYRSRDRKVMKSINYFRPNLKQFFTQEELDNITNQIKQD